MSYYRRELYFDPNTLNEMNESCVRDPSEILELFEEDVDNEFDFDEFVQLQGVSNE